jgi:hypothetical protein
VLLDQALVTATLHEYCVHYWRCHFATVFLGIVSFNGIIVRSACSWCLISLFVKIIVGCGVVWPLAWLMTYRGVDCQLWSYVYNKCMEAELCSELARMLMSELRKHRCFDNAPK